MLDIPIEVKKTVGKRRTRGISDLGWNKNPYLYIMSFQGAPEIPEERASRQVCIQEHSCSTLCIN